MAHTTIHLPLSPPCAWKAWDLQWLQGAQFSRKLGHNHPSRQHNACSPPSCALSQHAQRPWSGLTTCCTTVPRALTLVTPGLRGYPHTNRTSNARHLITLPGGSRACISRFLPRGLAEHPFNFKHPWSS